MDAKDTGRPHTVHVKPSAPGAPAENCTLSPTRTESCFAGGVTSSGPSSTLRPGRQCTSGKATTITIAASAATSQLRLLTARG
ncbi:MAG: hypothetical protein E6J60_07930 [Deltaproteobacteria bacterium]|nr:MAG: hypothetical protein E6J60_07930 [Deltaproteobacteria bacterium]